jgi:hypothetical protein
MARDTRLRSKIAIALVGVSALALSGCADWRGFESAWYYDDACVGASGGFVGVQGGAEDLGFFAIVIGAGAVVAGAAHLLFGGE